MTVSRWLRASVIAAGVFGGTIGYLLWTNPAPTVPPVSAVDLSTASTPYVIKLHARWCPVCMVTKDQWASVQAAYQGRVRLVVFDFTTDATTEASRADAKRMGLDAIFEDYVGETGTVLVVDGVTKDVKDSLHGNRELAEYRAAIDAALTVR
jgi:thiol-disulfide isomerase/thioredoxin